MIAEIPPAQEGFIEVPEARLDGKVRIGGLGTPSCPPLG
jgi:hypothetical protein